MPDYVAKLSRKLAEIDRRVSNMHQSGLGQSSIEGGGIEIRDRDGNYLTTLGEHPDGSYGVGYNIDSTVITPGGIETPSLAANSITADKLEALLVLVSAIVAGDPAGACAVMDATGFTTRAVTADGTQYVSTRLGMAEGDALEIVADPNQPPVAAISSAGDVSGATLASGADVTLQGVPLMGKLLDPESDAGILDGFSQGCQARIDFKPLVNNVTVVDNVDFNVGQFSVVLRPGRVYQFVMPWRAYVSASSGQNKVNITTWLYATFGDDAMTEPPDPKKGDVPLGHQSQTFEAGGVGINDTFTIPIVTPHRSDGASVQVKFLLALWARYGNVSPDTTTVPSVPIWIGTIFDQGPAPEIATATPPGAPTNQTITTTWVASDSRAWNDAGNRLDTGAGGQPAPGVQLWQSGAPGARAHSAVVFNGVGTVGENKTVPAAIGGKTLIRAELFLYQTWAESDNNPQVEVRPWTGTTLPATKAVPGVSSNIVKHFYTARAQGAWFDIPTSFITSTQTGIWIASPDWGFPNAHTHLGGAADPTTGRRPRLRLTYR